LPLESATFISDLTTSNPAHTDPLSASDSHIRLIKSTVKATFPNFTSAALQSTQAQLDAAAAVAAGTAVHTFPAGTAALPGLTCVLDPSTGWSRPAANQLAYSIAGSQVLLMGGTALVTSLALAAPAIATTGAYSGGSGQLVPIGATLIWNDDVLPVEGGYCWANGQIIASAATVCPVLLARWGNKFGGDGVTTMGVPDYRDTVPIGKSTMGGVASRGLMTLANTVLGHLLGIANNVLVAANLPPYTPSGTVGVPSITSGGGTALGVASGTGQQLAQSGSGSSPFFASGSFTTLAVGAPTFTGSAQGGTSTPVNNVQPSTTCNYILRLA
jgi:microcystin-dependent protein